MPDLLRILGGLGLFLIGMTVMRDGLKSLVDRTATKWMSRFTRTPILAALTGFVVTVLLQSSSAVSVMTVGFVGAGLLSFSCALGVILGANVGSTVTGWLVALIGFKFDLQSVTLPLIFVGAILRLFGRPKIASLGFALAGFGLVFSGVASLQAGLRGIDQMITPTTFPGDTWRGRFLLLLLGLGITLITHSSAAGVAMAVAAAHVGSLSLYQAAAMVIGMDIGTTATAALATIGNTVNARRTGFAHVFFNLLTGVGAFVSLPLFILTLQRIWPESTAANPELALVGFHTTFNVLGVVLMLPFVDSFARTVEWLVPQRNGLTRRLDISLLGQPRLALTTVRATLREISSHCSGVCRKLLTTNSVASQESELVQCQIALDETRHFLEQIPRSSADTETWPHHVDCLHVVDHLARLLMRLRQADRVESVHHIANLRTRAQSLADALNLDPGFEANDTQLAEKLNAISMELNQSLDSHRRMTVEQAAQGEVTLNDALATLDGFRWLRRVSFHFYRIAAHLRVSQPDSKLATKPTTEIEEESPGKD